jgi:2-(1,2-epoxy-1,2-dihydrophenyl)acetyl-CoA isomerase
MSSDGAGNNNDRDILTRLEDGVLTVTLNRPQSLNGLTITMTRVLNDRLREAAASPEVRAVVLTGAGRAFCAGGDIKEFDAIDERDSDWVKFRNDPVWNDIDTSAERTRRASEGPLLLHGMGKPTIAMVRGACVGASVALASACDFRIVSDTAFFSTAFARIGISGELGTSYYLTRLVGVAKARELFFFADRVPADEALRIGLVNKVVPDADLEKETLTFARRLADGPPLAYRYIKANLNAAETKTAEEMMGFEAVNQVRALRSDDAKEAIKAFFEKRTPKFTGR